MPRLGGPDRELTVAVGSHGTRPLVAPGGMCAVSQGQSPIHAGHSHACLFQGSTLECYNWTSQLSTKVVDLSVNLTCCLVQQSNTWDILPLAFIQGLT